MSTDIITELRSAATTLRTPTGCVLPAQDRITAELLDRAANALQGAQVGNVADGIGFGELLSVDFEADTITLRMEPGYQVRAGRHGLFHTQHDTQGQAAIDLLSTQLKHYRMAAEAEASLADRRQQEIDRLRVMLAEAEAARDRAQDDAGRYRILREGLTVRDVFNARWLRDNGNPETLDAALDIFASGSGAKS